MRLILILLLALAAPAISLEKSIDTASNGPVLLIAGSPDSIIRVQCVFIVAASAASFWLSGTYSLTGAIPLQPYACFFTPWYAGFNWFTLLKGASLYLNQTTGAQLSGRIYYTIGP